MQNKNKTKQRVFRVYFIYLEKKVFRFFFENPFTMMLSSLKYRPPHIDMNVFGNYQFTVRIEDEKINSFTCYLYIYHHLPVDELS